MTFKVRLSVKRKIAAAVLSLVAIGLAAFLLLGDSNIAVLNPKGLIANEQRNLIIFTVILSLFVIIPVYVLTAAIAWKYRADNKKANHSPDWEKHNGIEAVMWGIPCAIILVLSIVTWRTTHSLDPFRPIDSDKKPLTVQVVALQWKWLFIYPEEDIATVNYVRFPENRPVNFEITSDAPMNSFWIPQLGGQIYAMSGMSTKLHLQADDVGKYNGSSANISGGGFAGMKFVAESTTDKDFADWVLDLKASSSYLSGDVYDELAKPSKDNEVLYYSSAEPGLYDKVIMKYRPSKHR